jgi:HlyD family secretion protein
VDRNSHIVEAEAKESEASLAKSLKSLRIDRSAGEPPVQRRRGWPLMATLVLTLGVGGVLAYYALPSSRVEREVVVAPPTPAPVAAATEPARSRALVASGYAVARRKATIAAEITGKVVEVLVEEGMVVKKGDVLARLDSVLDERDLALAQSRADAAEAAIGAITADLRDAERIYNRTQRLMPSRGASEADLTRSEARVDVLRAQLKQAEAQFATAKLEAKRAADLVEKHNIRAPFTGVVIERSAQPGEMISPLAVGGFTRTGICTLVDMDSIEVEVDVNETFIGRVQPGMRVDAVFDTYPDWVIPATVVAVVPTANREKATVKVRIKLKTKEPRILPDMAVKVTFEPGGVAGDVVKGESAAN